MNIISMASLTPDGSITAKFQGYRHRANISLFVVNCPTGKGAEKHRHPYEETFVILDGNIEFIADGETKMIESGNIIVIPANTWHEFKNRSDHVAVMVSIHPVSKMIQEFWTRGDER